MGLADALEESCVVLRERRRVVSFLRKGRGRQLATVWSVRLGLNRSRGALPHAVAKLLVLEVSPCSGQANIAAYR